MEPSPQVRRALGRKGCAGNLTIVLADLGGSVVLSTNVQGVVGAIRSHCVSSLEKVGQAMRLEKGTTLLSRYPEQESARLLGEGLRWFSVSRAH